MKYKAFFIFHHFGRAFIEASKTNFLERESLTSNVTDPMIFLMIFIFLFCCGKACDIKEFSGENSKLCCESQIMTR